MKTFTSLWEYVMLQGCWPVVGIYNVTRLMMYRRNPVRKLRRIWNSGTQEHKTHLFGSSREEKMRQESIQVKNDKTSHYSTERNKV